MNATAEFVSHTCLDCKRVYPLEWGRMDALCLDCRAKRNAADLARTECPRCHGPMVGAIGRFLCGGCADATFFANIEKYGSG